MVTQQAAGSTRWLPIRVPWRRVRAWRWPAGHGVSPPCGTLLGFAQVGGVGGVGFVGDVSGSVVATFSAGGGWHAVPVTSGAVHPPVKTELRHRSGRAMAVCLHRSLAEDIVIAVSLNFTRVVSGGNPRSGNPRSDNGGAAGVALPHEGIVFGSSGWTVVFGGRPGDMQSSILKMDQWLMEVTSSKREHEAIAEGLLHRSCTLVSP